MYQNLIYISRYLDFYYQILNPYLPLTASAPTHPHPYLPLNNFFKANEHMFLRPILYLVAKCQMSSGPHGPIFIKIISFQKHVAHSLMDLKYIAIIGRTSFKWPLSTVDFQTPCHQRPYVATTVSLEG